MAQTRATPVATPMTSRCAWGGGAPAGCGLANGVALVARMARAGGEPPSLAAGAASAFSGRALAAGTPR